MPVRHATTTDISALVHVINRAYEVEAHIFVGGRTTERDVRERLAKPNASFLVIDDDDASAEPGTLAGAVYVEVDRERGYFGMLSVHPERQGRGLGLELVRATKDYCRVGGCDWLDIDVVDVRPELLGFYAKLGFAEVGATPYPDSSITLMPVQLIRMTKRIAASPTL